MSQQPEMERREIERAGVDIGQGIRTKFMERFTTGAEADGKYKMDLATTISRIRAASRLINRIGAERLLVCAGLTKAETPTAMFCEKVGARRMDGRFWPGTLTNPSLHYYIEPSLVLVTEPQIDAQAVTEATNAGIPVIGVSNTNNITSCLDIVIPANTMGTKAMAAVFWLLARSTIEEGGGDPDAVGPIKGFENKAGDEPEQD
ncbi:MAG: 30S ribosomal protein S2 [Nitrosopumilus sp.]|nr:30S ribosomal protein S2 [Nitrosopumilus sp.]CAI9831002.1 30S ribosomal protein S2 [Nitrosopumilaceae archaeon]MDA7941708.1 30S ribosomal protein S2 [Nitrosopumilus sp.]MDA7943998.1 30S ribosomal protein S2 [Nitrosopumilus sp.]MDA7944974.1 30S ribosomal protein S2 [Nitrosopumilus sp.]